MGLMALLYNQTIHSNDSDDADGFPRGSVMNARRLLSPVYEDAGLGEHQEPEIPLGGFGALGGEAVVHQHPSVRQPSITGIINQQTFNFTRLSFSDLSLPKASEDNDHCHQHFHHLPENEQNKAMTRLIDPGISYGVTNMIISSDIELQ